MLVVAEMALAVILLVGAALMIRTFAGLRSVQPGFESHNVITVQTSLTNGRYDSTVEGRSAGSPGNGACRKRCRAWRRRRSTVMLPVEGGVDLPFAIEGSSAVTNGDTLQRR